MRTNERNSTVSDVLARDCPSYASTVGLGFIGDCGQIKETGSQARLHETASDIRAYLACGVEQAENDVSKYNTRSDGNAHAVDSIKKCLKIRRKNRNNESASSPLYCTGWPRATPQIPPGNGQNEIR